ncbi:MAG: FAD binding domain-containing protein [Syntrophales bacterium]
MRPFDYRAADSLEEAVVLLAERGRRSHVMAGGTDLLVQLRAGRIEADRIVDIKRIPETNVLSYDPKAGLAIGAAVPCCRITEDPLIQAHYPVLVDAASLIGSVAVQGRATIGGNLCNAAPSGDSLPALYVLGVRCRVLGPEGERTIPVERFCTGPGKNVLESGEMLVSILIPPPRPHSGARYLRFIPRNEMDIAVVGVGAEVDLSPDFEMIVAARIALGAVAPTPILATKASDFLCGHPPSEAAICRAASLARKAARPITDMRGSIPYRRQLVDVLVRRALQEAIERARQNQREATENGV